MVISEIVRESRLRAESCSENRSISGMLVTRVWVRMRKVNVVCR